MIETNFGIASEISKENLSSHVKANHTHYKHSYSLKFNCETQKNRFSQKNHSSCNIIIHIYAMQWLIWILMGSWICKKTLLKFAAINSTCPKQYFRTGKLLLSWKSICNNETLFCNGQKNGAIKNRFAMHYLASDRSTTRPCQLDKNVFLVASFSHALIRGMLFGSQCPADILWDAASGWKACYWPLLNARCNRVLLSRGTGIHKQTCIYYAKFRVFQNWTSFDIPESPLGLPVIKEL